MTVSSPKSIGTSEYVLVLYVDTKVELPDLDVEEENAGDGQVQKEAQAMSEFSKGFTGSRRPNKSFYDPAFASGWRVYGTLIFSWCLDSVLPLSHFTSVSRAFWF